jgi:uncharacterized protein (DUF2147 family)
MLRFSLGVALIALSLTTTAYAQSIPSLLGKWAAKNGTSTVNIAPCLGSTDLCATVIAEKRAPNEPSSLGKVAVQGIRADGKKGWRGRFVDNGADYPASVKMKGADIADFKICVFAFVCETQQYRRLP